MLRSFYNSLYQGSTVFTEIHPASLINSFIKLKIGGFMNARQLLFLPM